MKVYYLELILTTWTIRIIIIDYHSSNLSGAVDLTKNASLFTMLNLVFSSIRKNLFLFLEFNIIFYSPELVTLRV